MGRIHRRVRFQVSRKSDNHAVGSLVVPADVWPELRMEQGQLLDFHGVRLGNTFRLVYEGVVRDREEEDGHE